MLRRSAIVTPIIVFLMIMIPFGSTCQQGPRRPRYIRVDDAPARNPREILDGKTDLGESQSVNAEFLDVNATEQQHLRPAPRPLVVIDGYRVAEERLPTQANGKCVRAFVSASIANAFQLRLQRQRHLTIRWVLETRKVRVG